MRFTIDPGKKNKCLTLLDNITYSTVCDESGNQVELKLSLLMQHGNVEARMANGIKPEVYAAEQKKPVIVWIPGGGYRGADKNLMVNEMNFLADKGFAVASIYCRGSNQNKYPAQLIDVKSAIRFLRANAEKYSIDPNKIATMGRSSGAHLAVLAGLNLSGYDFGENLDYNSNVNAVCNWFGPVDLPYLLALETEKVKDPKYRYTKIEDTHLGALFGGDIATLKDRFMIASAPHLITENVAPMLIMHGDMDRHVPMVVSENLYNALVEKGYEHQTDLYIIKNANHGSDEFFQPEVKQIVVDFFEKYLK